MTTFMFVLLVMATPVILLFSILVLLTVVWILDALYQHIRRICGTL